MPRPAHRPSRRDDIIDAAIAVFARRGYVETSVSDVANAAEVAVTAVYYHFAGKDDLYGAAVAKVLAAIDDVVAQARADDTPGDDASLGDVIDAVWDWVDAHPDAATLVYVHGHAATRQAAARRQEFDELHVRRAFSYVGQPAETLTEVRRGAATIAVRTLVDLLIAVHPMRMDGGPLSTHSPAELRSAVKAVSTRLVHAV